MATAPKVTTSSHKVLLGEVTGADGVVVTAGSEKDTVELTEADAKRLAALGFIAPLPAAEATAPAEPAKEPEKKDPPKEPAK